VSPLRALVALLALGSPCWYRVRGSIRRVPSRRPRRSAAAACSAALEDHLWQSLGGHIVVRSLRPGVYEGGLAESGLVDGISIADYLMAYTAAAERISGVPLLDVPGSYTARGQQFDSAVQYLTGADQAGNDLPQRLPRLRRRFC